MVDSSALPLALALWWRALARRGVLRVPHRVVNNHKFLGPRRSPTSAASLLGLAEAGDFHEFENTVSELVKFLDSLLDAAVTDPDSEMQRMMHLKLSLRSIDIFVLLLLTRWEVVDALSFELPKAVSKFVGISSRIWT
ncbi:hypothetical protein JHK82_039514 [Glycine max]|nr:hypothetical protein JHK86_039701 [Glycine max]KAG4965303.1 hypothetical protein JHK85_040278 [Glycine max]KAG5110291.1 hypothetical protein JHK82_039514 [Glycine max]KAG5121578.1 hypothetical protein JHK84_039918 [Glycine max]